MTRATRWKAEVRDRDGNVLWEVLVHDQPAIALRSALAEHGFKILRASNPQKAGPLPLTYSELDPANSIRAAREYAARHDRKISNVLVRLIDANGGWVSKADICRASVGGDQGDKRARELRARNWPIEIRQLHAGKSWHYRLPLPGDEPSTNGDSGDDHEGRLW